MRTALFAAILLPLPAMAGPVFYQGPLVSGEDALLTVTGVDAGASVSFAASTAGFGPGPCIPALGGLCLDIRNPVTDLGSATANGSGVASLQVPIPAGLPLGLWVHTQAVVTAPTVDKSYVISAQLEAASTGGLFVHDIGTVATSTWTGDDAGSKAGTALDLGDLDGDGHDDLLVGAELQDDGGTANTGAVYIAYGSDAPGAYTLATGPTFFGGSADDRLGSDVASAGDVDGDGYFDLLVSATESDGIIGEGGSVHLLYGSAVRESGQAGVGTMDAAWHGDIFNGGLGTALASGDLDGDGYSDIIMGHVGFGVIGFDGGVYIEYGGSTRYAGAAAATGMDGYVGDWDDRMGQRGSIAAGDLDGDGYDELVMGAWGGLGRYVYIASGSSTRVSGMLPATGLSKLTQADAAADQFGSAVSVVGDVNGDGYDDLAVGDYTHNLPSNDAGTVWLFAGSAAGFPPAFTPAAAFAEVTGAASSDYVGKAVSPAGDFSGDGVDDVAISTWGWDTPFADGGGLVVFEGGASLAGTMQIDDQGTRLEIDAGSMFLGSDVAMGFMDSDANPDLVVSAQNAAGAAGVTYLLRGGSF